MPERLDDRRHLQRAALARAGLESVPRHEIVVVDHGSTDGTLELVRERFPEAVVVEQENLGFGAGNNAGMRAASGRWYLLLNSDAWLVPGALDALVAFAEAHPDAAVVGPRLRNPDGSLQRSVRGFPTVWRIATEYLFLRKLAPRSRALNAFYAGGFDHDDGARGGVADGLRAARAPGGGRGRRRLRRALLHVQRGDRLVLPLPRRPAGRSWFFPGAEVVHVGGRPRTGAGCSSRTCAGTCASSPKHRGEREAERARRLLLVALAAARALFRGERGARLPRRGPLARLRSHPALLER